MELFVTSPHLILSYVKLSVEKRSGVMPMDG